MRNKQNPKWLLRSPMPKSHTPVLCAVYFLQHPRRCNDLGVCDLAPNRAREALLKSTSLTRGQFSPRWKKYIVKPAFLTYSQAVPAPCCCCTTSRAQIISTLTSHLRGSAAERASVSAVANFNAQAVTSGAAPGSARSFSSWRAKHSNSPETVELAPAVSDESATRIYPCSWCANSDLLN